VESSAAGTGTKVVQDRCQTDGAITSCPPIRACTRSGPTSWPRTGRGPKVTELGYGRDTRSRPFCARPFFSCYRTSRIRNRRSARVVTDDDAEYMIAAAAYRPMDNYATLPHPLFGMCGRLRRLHWLGGRTSPLVCRNVENVPWRPSVSEVASNYTDPMCVLLRNRSSRLACTTLVVATRSGTAAPVGTPGTSAVR
jgi:hypothetical protein